MIMQIRGGLIKRTNLMPTDVTIKVYSCDKKQIVIPGRNKPRTKTFLLSTCVPNECYFKLLVTCVLQFTLCKMDCNGKPVSLHE